MKVEELKKACDDNKYIIVRTYGGQTHAFNCKAADIAMKKAAGPKMETNYISFSPCSFQEYISKKIPFI